MENKIKMARQYLSLVTEFSNDRSAYELLLQPQMTETEYPNLLSPRLRQRTLEDGMKGIELGKQLLKFQRYDIRHWTEDSDSLTVEVTWTGEMGVDAGRLKKTRY